MGSDFQIQELIHQDGDGVLFQALDKQTGRLVSLQRFFLKEGVLKNLKEKGESGVSLFEEGLEWMKSLNVPHLQKVVGGGIDEIDGTPFFITEWIDGIPLAEAHERGVFQAGEGEAFAAQAKATLLSIPIEKRFAVFLDKERIQFSRDDAGGANFLFFLSPLRYFGALGGVEIGEVDREEVIEMLASHFPNPPVVEATAVEETPVPVLKSAQQSSGKGLLWTALVGLIALLIVGGWLVINSDEVSEQVAESKFKQVEVSNEVSNEESGSQGELQVEEEDVEVTEIASAVSEPEALVTDLVESEDVVKLDEPVEGPSEESEDAVAMAVKEDASLNPEAENEPVETKPIEEESVVVLPVEEVGAVASEGDYFTPDDLKALKAKNGEKVLFRGKVEESNRSNNGKGVLLYLDFGDRATQPFVVFRFDSVKPPVQRSDWDEFVGEVVDVKATVSVRKGPRTRGSGVWLNIKKMSDVSIVPEKPKERVYEFSDLEDLKLLLPGKKVIFEGSFRSFRANGPKVYLFFEDGFSVAGRFDVGGPLSNQTFAKKLEELKGQRIRLVGLREKDDNARIEVAIQLNETSDVSLAE